MENMRICKYCGNKFKVPHKRPKWILLLTVISILGIVGSIMTDSPLFCGLAILLGCICICLWRITATQCPKCEYAFSIPLSDTEAVNEFLKQNEHKFPQRKKLSKSVKKNLKIITWPMIVITVIIIAFIRSVDIKPFFGSCSDYKMAQAFMEFIGWRDDSHIRYAVKHIQKEYGIKGEKTGWHSKLYGTPVCHMTMNRNIFSNFTDMDSTDMYVNWNPAKKTWEPVFGCYKSGLGYKCN